MKINFDDINDMPYKNDDDGYIINDEDTYGIPQVVLNGFREIGFERRTWERLLHDYLSQSGYKRPERKVRILDIGCAKALEAIVLKRTFKPAEFTGIDIETDFIRGAISHASDTNTETYETQLDPDYNFICGDASQLTKYVSGRFDIVVFPHPEFLDRQGNIDSTWAQIFTNAFSQQVPGDLLIVTCYLPNETEKLREVLAGNYDIRVCERNKSWVRGTTPDHERNSQVLMAIKKETLEEEK